LQGRRGKRRKLLGKRLREASISIHITVLVNIFKLIFIIARQGSTVTKNNSPNVAAKKSVNQPAQNIARTTTVLSNTSTNSNPVSPTKGAPAAAAA